MSWNKDDPQGNESGKIKYLIVPFTRGRGLDLGCGPHKAFPHFIGVDSKKDTGLFGIEMTPDVEGDVTSLDYKDGSMDFVYSSHTLEHIVDFKAALAEWWRVIKVGGHLVLYLPHKDFYPNIGTDGSNPDHKHDFVPFDIETAMTEIAASTMQGWELLISEERNEGYEYSFLQVFKKRNDAECQHQYLSEKPAKTVCISRFGGFGDMIQTANLFPALKREGFHITVNTTPDGREIIKDDPHVDAWLIMDRDQVPNRELFYFWRETAKRFDRFVNLSESVEGALLALPGRPNHSWSYEMRCKHLDHNYLEFTSDLAGVPYASEAKFYPTEEERKWVFENLDHARFNIVWTLAGSSMHKAWPHFDACLARILMGMPEARIVLTGDAACMYLEQGWQAEKRVVCASGRIGIRQSLALAQKADLVVGPETGVLNAVAFEPTVGKVVMLSHSSKNNLTKHWVNTRTVEPFDTPCFPCHRLHYGDEYCHKYEIDGIDVPGNGLASLCAGNIDPTVIYEAIAKHYEAWLITRDARRAVQ